VGTTLLIAGLWAKQPAIAAGVAGGAWLVLLWATGQIDRKVVLWFILGYGLGNAAVLGLLALATGGWSTFYVLEVGQNHFKQPLLHTIVPPTGPCGDCGVGGKLLLKQTVFSVIAPIVVTAALWAVAAVTPTWRRGTRRSLAQWRRMSWSWTDACAVLAALFVAATMIASLEFQRKQGTHNNQLIGAAYGLGLLVALAWRSAQRSPARSLGVVVVMLAAVLVHHEKEGRVSLVGVNVPAFKQNIVFPNIPPVLLKIAKTKRVYQPSFGGLNAQRLGETYPGAILGIGDLLAAGKAPRDFERDLLTRHFDVTFLINNSGNDREHYASGYGQYEDGMYWKLDEVVKTKYALASQIAPGEHLPADAYVPRPGPDPAPWMNQCFGPFQVAGHEWRIKYGGGFWCQETPTRFRFRETPAALSQMVTDKPVEVQGGSVRLTPKHGPFELVNQTDPSHQLWHLTVLPVGKRQLQLTLGTTTFKVNGTSVDVQIARGGSGAAATLAPAGPDGAAAAGPATATLTIPDQVAKGTLTLTAAGQTRGTVDLGGLKLK
jgi:hypothetical protein